MRGLVLMIIPLMCWADEGQYQPRTLNNKAVMHVYYYAPATLEITYVESYLFKDVETCKDRIGQAGMIATPHASQGDLVMVSCVAMNPPEHKPDTPKGASEL